MRGAVNCRSAVSLLLGLSSSPLFIRVQAAARDAATGHQRGPDPTERDVARAARHGGTPRSAADGMGDDHPEADKERRQNDCDAHVFFGELLLDIEFRRDPIE
jgi:hypothetical protein